ncbi:hypothetical protein [Aquicoccus sp. SU-CL01552]|uniref:hypothetical protein n=1 Tax=Aquicoccus sp. SU-CL01552 TaxID=3127656 RepID=UPI00310AB0A7
MFNVVAVLIALADHQDARGRRAFDQKRIARQRHGVDPGTLGGIELSLFQRLQKGFGRAVLRLRLVPAVTEIRRLEMRVIAGIGQQPLSLVGLPVAFAPTAAVDNGTALARRPGSA